MLEIADAAAVVDDLFRGRVVIEGVHGEVAADGILGLIAEDVVAQEATVLVLVLVVIGTHLARAEGRDLDGVHPEHHVHEAEAASDDPGAPEDGVHLFRRGVGGDVVVLRGAVEHDVAHRAADDVCLVSVTLQRVGDATGVVADAVAGHAMLGDGDGAGPWYDGVPVRGSLAAAGKHLVEQFANHAEGRSRYVLRVGRPRIIRTGSMPPGSAPVRPTTVVVDGRRAALVNAG